MDSTRLLDPGRLTAGISGPSTLNEQTRQVTVTFTTTTPVLRSDGYGGRFYEVLNLDPGNVNLSRLQSGNAPLLDNHQNNSIENVLGVVESASVKNGVGTATIRFSTSPQGERAFQMVKEQTIKTVSIGYRVGNYTETTKKGDAIPTMEAGNIEIFEISLVGIPADPNAVIRNANLNKQNEVIVTSQKKEIEEMSEENNQSVIKAERKRAKEIRSLVKQFGVDSEYGEALIDNEVTLEQARKMVLEKLAIKPTEPVQNTARIEVGTENHDMRRRAFEEAVLHRMDPSNKITDLSRGLYGQSLLAQAQFIVPRHLMESDAAYCKRSMASADLSLSLANIAEKQLQENYKIQPKSYEQFCGNKTLRNFKNFSQIKAGDFPSLLERPEGDAFQFGSTGEYKETVTLKDHGIQISLSSQMLVNDDIGLLVGLAASGGSAAARLDNRLAFEALTTNRTMQDTVALYHADHGNLGSASAINAAGFKAAIKAMRSQMTTDGKDYLNLKPGFLIVGLDKEAEAAAFLASVNPNQTSQVNIYSNSVQLVVDPLISGNAWYLVADPRLIPGINIYRLEGQEAPVIDHQINWNTNSLDIKVAYAVQASAIEYKGLYYNPGA